MAAANAGRGRNLILVWIEGSFQEAWPERDMGGVNAIREAISTAFGNLGQELTAP